MHLCLCGGVFFLQDCLKINGIKVAQPDEDGYSAVLATTSTEDSDRDMTLEMHNTPIGTVEGYDLKWRNLSPQEAAVILQQVLNKSKFTVHYFDILTGKWRDGEFYASNFNAPCKTLEDDEECWDELSFNIRGIHPR